MATIEYGVNYIKRDYETLTGKIIGRWTVGEEIRKNGKLFYKCTCSCGTEKDVYRYSLMNGDSSSCGCLARENISKNFSIDHTGEKFGMLTAIERLAQYKNGKTYYRCVCDCGNEKIINGDNLVSGHTKSCGCDNSHRIARRKDYTGTKFSMLEVEEMLYNFNGSKTTYARCICDCGNEKIAAISSILRGATKSCGCLEASSRRTRIHGLDLSGKVFGELTVINRLYTDNNGHVVWNCRCNCGNYIEVNAANLTRAKTKSCGCKAYESSSLDLRGKVFGELIAEYPIQGSRNERRKWHCRCSCGNEVDIYTSELTCGNALSCGCKFVISKGEEYVFELLTDLKIQNIRQYRFKDCKNKKRLPFDFFLPEYNVCIEYQGEQHYRPVKYWGGEEGFKKRQKNDEIKRNYCNDNNITLICLPYTLSKSEIYEIIKNIKNPLTITAA